MLTIGKPAEFGSNGYPIRGQCQPHTKGWRLRLVYRGQEEVLHTDSYYACRQVQKECAGHSDDEVRSMVKDIVDQMSADLEETQRMTQASTGQDPDATPVDLPVMPGKGAEQPMGESDSTRVIGHEEMEEELRKRKQKPGAPGAD